MNMNTLKEAAETLLDLALLIILLLNYWHETKNRNNINDIKIATNSMMHEREKALKVKAYEEGIQEERANPQL
jgi:hypothetical protein